MPSLSDDLLHGAKAISLFIYGSAYETSTRRIYHAVDKLGLPTFRMGSTICARRSSILKWIERQEAA
ncbi:DNA-binding protein [Bosea sp. AAP35]|uniref:DNA-binding protein n=1 Tax=Bosea sp. AAP35 TaxID=1523417 RepID=UPI0020BD49CB|nr:DNA-binding protein [Bosea sp. AAP35]